ARNRRQISSQDNWRPFGGARNRRDAARAVRYDPDASRFYRLLGRFDVSNKHYAVIGAGAGGLCAAKNLLAKGIEATIFEIGSKIGGLWVYENDSGRSPAYRSLHINSEARVSSYIDFPFPPDTPLYPDTTQME